MTKNRIDQSFGNQQVESQERERRIRDVFNKVAPRYDLMNDVMSFGIHRLWKRHLAQMANAGTGQTIIDLAGGTGDIAIRLARPDNCVYVVDPSIAMMRIGRQRHHLPCIAAPAEKMPFSDASVDTLTIAFGIRNVTAMEPALAEMVRVLKPGGRCLILEFSTPKWWLKPFYDWHSFRVIPRLGGWVARQPAAYQYLVESIRKFPDQQAMKALLEQAGLLDVRYKNLSFGIACIHTGRKPAENQ
ncbi:MAG: bifunctional demethylmenaquinone methyltransferase/2-methoxy-6-polyprenyl-1,4-benzoquinol methylase UbiE [Candidatus Polarisedimenticolaceae bacterium]|nr:bifunctional demethylmenaquinone methyltransferase/2-methoxy-6-polyprenyl-1,4-benzoquinol methylase UbiE [Candidatus Polarisedimenticolaceae bacterium]